MRAITYKRRGEESDNHEIKTARHIQPLVQKAHVVLYGNGRRRPPAANNASLDIELIVFNSTDRNCRRFARREIAINPVAQLPHKTLFQELGSRRNPSTWEADFDFANTENIPRDLREGRGTDRSSAARRWR